MRTKLALFTAVCALFTLGVAMTETPAQAFGTLAQCINGCNNSYDFCTASASNQNAACQQGCSGPSTQLCIAQCEIKWEFDIEFCGQSRDVCYDICHATSGPV
ncbi:MAG: hypothetical protein AAF657_23155 [Acidobacteriota bacterium]